MEKYDTRLLKLSQNSTVVEAFKAFSDCCLGEMADKFKSVPGSTQFCGYCGNRMRGVLLKSKSQDYGEDIGSLRPSSPNVDTGLEPQSLFFHPRRFSADKIAYVATKHGLPDDALTETEMGYYLTLTPGNWYDESEMVVKKIAEGVLAIFSKRKEEFKDKERPDISEFSGTPEWWK